MKKTILIGLAIVSLYSCQKKETTTDVAKDIDSATVDTIVQTENNNDSIIVNNKKAIADPKVIDLIRKQLNTVLLKNDLAAMTKEDRFFYYDAFDLNNDEKDEYIVGLSSPYFCGTGGCSGFILKNDGSLLNKFTVTDFPIFVGTGTSEKFRDLIVSSKGILYNVKMKNGKYPSNPSVQEKWKGDVPAESPEILDIDNKKYEKISF
ncbi:hypothetical protein OIU80_02265 [Flavobacterium sp. LS1R47]|uniref:Uncharacterized protein n=1 Tax=Flavobacterium frigoritolerans TaxID=2987686 RepID=A0A9X3C5X3_9FLAO|nr:hypothetical protein [Flavobacterium frigoritolerans]MCV9931094.1 hypothetical protein [Flavobacterium frigoritolerans]